MLFIVESKKKVKQPSSSIGSIYYYYYPVVLDLLVNLCNYMYVCVDVAIVKN